MIIADINGLVNVMHKEILMYWTLFRSHVDWHRLVRSTILFIHVKFGSVADYSKTPLTNTRHCPPVHGDLTKPIKYLTPKLTFMAWSTSFTKKY